MRSISIFPWFKNYQIIRMSKYPNVFARFLEHEGLIRPTEDKCGFSLSLYSSDSSIFLACRWECYNLRMYVCIWKYVQRYLYLLYDCVVHFSIENICEKSCDKAFLFQQDNAPFLHSPYKLRTVEERKYFFFQNMRLGTNLIGHLWAVLSKTIQKHRCSSREKLFK